MSFVCGGGGVGWRTVGMRSSRVREQQRKQSTNEEWDVQDQQTKWSGGLERTKRKYLGEGGGC